MHTLVHKTASRLKNCDHFHVHSSFFYINICILVSFQFSFCFASWILKNALLSGFSWKTFEQAKNFNTFAWRWHILAHSHCIHSFHRIKRKKRNPQGKNLSLYVSFRFSSFLFIVPFLHAQKRLTFRVIMTSQPVGKQISTTNWWCVFHLCDSPKGANASFKKQLDPHFFTSRADVPLIGDGPHCIQQDGTWGVLASFSSVYVVCEILHPLDGTPGGLLAAYWRWQYAMWAQDTGMP